MQQSQSAFITGGSQGLGLETAKQLAQAGWRIGLFARDLANLKSAREELILDYPELDVCLGALRVQSGGERYAVGPLDLCQAVPPTPGNFGLCRSFR